MKITRTLMALLLCLCLLPLGAARAESALTEFIPTWENVKPLGRTHQLDNALWLVHSASGAEFTFFGTQAEITILGDNTAVNPNGSHARIAIEVDGVRVVDDMIDAAEKAYTIHAADEGKDVTIRILKLSESMQSTCGIGKIAVDADAIRPTAKSARRIEFIGDSITCGYGVDDENRDHHFSTTTEDATKTYAYKTAMALGADYSMVSFSGHGIISGYTGTPGVKSNQLVPAYYEKLGFGWNAFQGQNVNGFAWDFAAFEPDVVVVNLGTNDDSYVKGDPARAEEYVAGYVAFIKTIREKNPHAKIVCSLGIMGDSLYMSVVKTMKDYIAQTGDENIACVRFAVQQTGDGYAADWHPTERTHEKAAQKLTAELKRLMGWE